MVFAMLAGSYPAPDLVSAVRDQVAAGIEPVTGGRRTVPLDPGAAAALVADLEEGRGSGALADWSTTAAAAAEAGVAAAATLAGPWSLAMRAFPGSESAGRRVACSLTLAEALGAEAAALVAAGCRLIRIDEPAALAASVDDASRAAFAAAHRRLTAGVRSPTSRMPDAGGTTAGPHLMLALTGGDHQGIGATTLADLPYASFLFDLIDGPDDWRLIAAIPGDRGIVCGVVHPTVPLGDPPEILVWAAMYAASTGGRGLVRVGVATTGDLDGIGRDAAAAKLRALGEGARIAMLPRGELAASLDPRALDLRSAALGRWSPDPRMARPRGGVDSGPDRRRTGRRNDATSEGR